MVTGSEKDNISKVSLGLGSNLGDKIMPEGSDLNGDLQNNRTLGIELELLLLLQNRGLFIERERDLNISRSGSAPPTVEGALRSAGSLHRTPNFALSENDASVSNEASTEEEIRSHPAYLAYYYSNQNSNPRLPPPLLSREDWRVAQRVQGGGSTMGGNGKRRNKQLPNDSGSSSLFSMQPRVPIYKADTQPIELRKTAVRNLSRKNSTESLAALSMPQKSGMGVRRKSFADIVQEGIGQSSASPAHLSRRSSHNSLSEVLNTADISNTSTDSQSKEESFDALHPPQLGPGFSGGLALPNSFTSTGSSSTKIRTSEPHPTLRSPPGFPVARSQVSVDREENIACSNSHDPSSGKTQISDILTSLPRLSLPKDQVNDSTLLQYVLEMGLSNAHIQNLQRQFNKSRADKYVPPHGGFTRENGVTPDVNYINFDRQVNFPRRTSSSVNLRSLANSSEFPVLQDHKIRYQGSHPSGYILNGQSQRRSSSRGHPNLHSPDVQHDELLEQSTNYTLQTAAMSKNLAQGRNSIGTSHDFIDLQDPERIYFEALLAQRKQQFPLNYQYHGNPTVSTRTSRQANPMASSISSAIRPGVQFQNERSSHFPAFKVQVGGSSGSCNTTSGTTVEGKLSSSLLEELKNNKSKSLELLDVLDHVVEFSMDQYGSRFIQQKLETATIEDKMKIFPLILPHARGLMTDVFGNYVIQKFFEHGMEGQRKELASQLLGHVLPLSLQMYGCRVIQKALEVVDLEQQIQMVAELNGSVMKCVRDQNGNHVIQKCIECVPQDQIQFIISSFFGQVVALSTHPYGCRVIQRVLEHCDDPNTQQIIMDEIMKSVCALAQDQYGNYVIQHVLQHGKPHEKTEIIAKLAGQIVKMSQQKFASNVVEKCLTFGGPEERKILINEMLGSTDENEALQAMMKDPFGNYVVQKVLETCDDQSRELIISRIKLHLNALKRYTYGKHIVSRVEKLIETGERHMGVKT